MPEQNDPNSIFQAGMGYSPMFQGLNNPYLTGMENVPYFGSGLQSMFGSMLAQPLMDRIGMFPAGVGTNRNFYDTAQRMQFSKLQRQAASDAGHLDASNYYDTFRGVSNLFGVEFGPDQQRAAAAFSGRVAAAAPILGAIRPDILEQMGGSRGSATVLAQRLAESGRYQVDPVRGTQGLDRESIRAMTEGIFKSMVDSKGNNQYGGLMAGQVGELKAALQSRGISSGGGDFNSNVRLALGQMDTLSPADLQAAGRRRGVNVAGGIDGLTSQDLDKLSGDEEVGKRLRTVDLDRTKRMLKDYSKAVGVMKEIFGDMGRPNAPVSELINGLDALTNGASHRLDPERLAETARRTQTLAEQAGMPVQKALAMQATFSQAAQSMGLDSTAGVRAMQTSVAFGAGLQGSGALGKPVFDRASLDQQTQMAGMRTLYAAGSETAAALAAAVSFSDTVGGFQPGSDAHRLVSAIRNHDDFFVDASGKRRSVNLNPEEVKGMVAGAKTAKGEDSQITPENFTKRMYQRDAVAEVINREKIDSTVFRTQAEAARTTFAQATSPSMQTDIAGHLRLLGATDDQARQMAQRALDGGGSLAAANAFLGISGYDHTKGARTIGETVLAQLEKDPATKALLSRMSPDQRRIFLEKLGQNTIGALGDYSRQNNYGASASDFQAQFGDEGRQAVRRQELRAQATDSLKSVYEGLQPEEPTRNLVDALKAVRPGDRNALGTLAAKFVGGVDRGDVAERYRQALEELKKAQDGSAAAMRDVARLPPEQQEAALNAVLLRAREEKAAFEKIKELNQQYGVGGQGSSVVKIPQEALEAGRNLDVDRLESAAEFSPTSKVSDRDADAAMAVADPLNTAGLSKAEKNQVALRVAAARKKELLGHIRAGTTSPTSPEAQKELEKAIEEQVGSREKNPEKYLAELDRQEAHSGADDPFVQFQSKILLDKDLGKILTRDEGRAYTRAVRQTQNPRMSPEEFKAFRKKYPGLSESQAGAIGDLVNGAKAMGMTRETIEDILAKSIGDGTTGEGPYAEGESPFERAFRGLSNQIDRSNMIGLDRSKLPEETARLAKAFEDSKGKEGTKQGESRVNQAIQQYEKMAAALDSNPTLYAKGGKEAWESAARTRDYVKQLDDLAKEHAGGSVFELSRGNFTGLADIKTPEQARQYEATQARVNDLFRRLQLESVRAAEIAGGKEPNLTPEERAKKQGELDEHVGQAETGRPGEKSPGAGLLKDYGFDPKRLTGEERAKLAELDKAIGGTQFGSEVHESLHQGMRMLNRGGKGSELYRDFLGGGEDEVEERLGAMGTPEEVEKMKEALYRMQKMGLPPAALQPPNAGRGIAEAIRNSSGLGGLAKTLSFIPGLGGLEEKLPSREAVGDAVDSVSPAPGGPALPWIEKLLQQIRDPRDGGGDGRQANAGPMEIRGNLTVDMAGGMASVTGQIAPTRNFAA